MITGEGKKKSKFVQPQFPGEKHAPQIAHDGARVTGVNIGPGTKFIKGIETGRFPVSKADLAARKHDGLYYMHQTEQDIRDADIELIDDLEDLEDEGEPLFNTRPAILAMRAKMFGENAGLIARDKFSGKPRDLDPATIKLIEDDLRKMTALSLRGGGMEPISELINPIDALKLTMIRKRGVQDENCKWLSLHSFMSALKHFHEALGIKRPPGTMQVARDMYEFVSDNAGESCEHLGASVVRGLLHMITCSISPESDIEMVMIRSGLGAPHKAHVQLFKLILRKIKTRDASWASVAKGYSNLVEDHIGEPWAYLV